ncbi:hypothetical protein BJ878DRAFT_561286 [Calycina marina]|uniref:Uncharacterized protein n=1 Tax=Calycina marina TaxID=1763456 RepID=A0A9P7Z6J4_9HELO|nr:hypothetical protein BJ878DRAFT_561286 [Calycina marina]
MSLRLDSEIATVEKADYRKLDRYCHMAATDGSDQWFKRVWSPLCFLRHFYDSSNPRAPILTCWVNQQELLAPQDVIFLDQSWEELGMADDDMGLNLNGTGPHFTVLACRKLDVNGQVIGIPLEHIANIEECFEREIGMTPVLIESIPIADLTPNPFRIRQTNLEDAAHSPKWASSAIKSQRIFLTTCDQTRSDCSAIGAMDGELRNNRHRKASMAYRLHNYQSDFRKLMYYYSTLL